MEKEATVSERNTFSFFIITGLAFLIPLFFIPVDGVPFQFSKVLLAVFGAASLIALFSIRVLRSGSLSLNRSTLLGAALLLPLFYGISALFSNQPNLSFFGLQLETDTFGFMLLGAALVFGIVQAQLSRERIFSVLTAFFLSSALILVFGIVQLVLSLFGVSLFGQSTFNTIGGLNDLGVFVGMLSVISLLALETLRFSRVSGLLVWLLFATSLFFLALVNLTSAWWLVGIFAFSVVLFGLFRSALYRGNTENYDRRVPIAGLIILVAAVVGVFFGGLYNPLQTAFGVQNLEVRPSLAGTSQVLTNVYSENALFGSGPGTFASQWLLYRPDGILQTIFWNASFGVGSGFIPTAATTGGIVVLLGWLLFLLALGYTAVRGAMLVVSDQRGSFLVMCTALVSVYLAALHFFYAPSQAITLLFFMFTGLFIASLAGTRFANTTTWSFADAPRLGFAAVFASTVVLVLSVSAFIYTSVAYTSATLYGRAIVTAQSGDLDRGFEMVTQAFDLKEQDRYLRTLALIDSARIQELLSSVEGEELTAAQQEEFRTYLTRAIENANRALALNNQNFQNWLLRASLYGSAVPLGINGAYEATIATLEEARALNPKSPEIDFRIAQAHASADEVEDARASIAQALERRPNYTDAILLRAQIELNAGNLDEAIESLYAAVYFEPQNQALLYQLGLLLLEDEAYDDARQAFEAALAIQPEFANASFFLAQAYSFLDREDEAVAILETLQETNPDNELIPEYLARFASGENPFERGTVSPESESELEAVE